MYYDFPMKIICTNPECKSNNIIKNGLTYSKTQKYQCKDCGKYFTTHINSNIPKTDVPFYFIIHMLNFKKKAHEQLGNKIPKSLFNFRKRVNFWYTTMGYNKEIPPDMPFNDWYNDTNGFTRQRIRYWIKKYWNYLDDEEIVQEAKEFFNKRMDEILKKAITKGDFEEDIVWKEIKTDHMEVLEYLIYKFGKEKCLEIMSDKDRSFFDYLIRDYRLRLVHLLKVGNKEIILNYAAHDGY